MVTGTEKIFEDVYEARDYVLALEQSELDCDVFRKKPPMMCCQNDGFRARPLSIPIDSLDFPLVAYFNEADEDKFIMTQLQSGRYSLKPNLRNRKFLFRGETEFHDPCKPSLFRDAKKTYFLDPLIYGDEMFRLILSHPLVQLLDVGLDLNGKRIRFEMNLYGLTQHYYNQTSLLDLTSDIDVALFFATQHYDSKTDSYYPIVDENEEKIGVLYYYSLDCITDFVPSLGGRMSTIGLQAFPRSGRQKGFLYDCDKDSNFNDHAQLKAVRFKHKEIIANEVYAKMDGGRRLFPRDILQDHWAGIKKGRVSLDAVYINVDRNREEDAESIRAKLNRCGIEVVDYKPLLTEEELHRYYEAVRKENLWEVFCDQIYIPGDKDGKMMAALRNVPNNPKYNWAFKEGIPPQIDYDQGFLLKHYKKVLMRE